MAPTATSHRREIELEDLCDLAAPEAIERLRERELRPAIEPYEVDDPARHACVLDQHPPAGERVRHGQLVTLIVGQHTPPSAAAEVPLPAHDAPAVDREPELAQRATWTGQERSSAMPASAAGVVEDESEPQTVVEEPEPELVVIPAGWQPIPDGQTPLAPSAGRARGGGVASRRGRRRWRWVAVLAAVLALLAGLSLVAGQRRAAGSRGVARAVSSLRSETSGTSSTTSSATSAARAAGPRPAGRRRADEHHHREHRAAVSALPAGAASASTPASAPVAPVAGAPESSPPAPAPATPPALTTPPPAAAPAGSGVVVVPPSATGPLGGPYPNQ